MQQSKRTPFAPRTNSLASRNTILAGLALTTMLGSVACDRIGSIKGHTAPNPLSATPVYESNREVIFQGSVYYAQASCAKCHGVAFDGQGPDATATKNETGVAVPGFKGTTIGPEKTPLAYFKTITMGTEKLPTHSNQAYTDRGRWAMAHFLYSLTTKPAGGDALKHDVALANAEAEIREAYSNNRRWVMGYKKIEDRPQAPKLDELLKLTNVSEDRAAAPVDEARIARRDRGVAGYREYENNCAGCHGLYGEGMASSQRFGLIDCGPERKRQCGVYLSTPDFQNNAALGGVGAFKSAHDRASAEGQNMRSFSHLSDDEWQDLLGYVKHLTGR
ncbi:MAG: cytochrome c [Leptospirales bacterium]|jgi:mono/diheme cytochrome c family protein